MIPIVKLAGKLFIYFICVSQSLVLARAEALNVHHSQMANHTSYVANINKTNITNKADKILHEDKSSKNNSAIAASVQSKALVNVPQKNIVIPKKNVSDLLSVYHLALDNDMTLATAQAVYNASLENKPIARSALLPQLSLTALTSWNKQVNNYSTAVNKAINKPALSRTFGWNDHQWGASITQPIFDVGLWFDLQVAKSQNVQSLLKFRMAQEDLIMRVAKNYFNVLHLEDTLATAKSEQRAVQRQMIQAKQRFKVGLLPRADVEEVKASYDAVAVKVIQAKNDVNLAYKKLATITKEPVSSLAPLGLEISLYRPEPAQSSEWVRQAVANNLSMKVARSGVKVSEQKLRSSRSADLPTLDASVTFTHDTINASRSFNKANNTVYSLNMTLPVFTGGKNSATILQNRFKLESSQYQEELEKRTVSQDALSYYDSVNADISKVKAACQGVISADTAKGVTNKGYFAGIRTIMDVLQSQQNYYTAQQLYFDSRYGYILDMLQLKRTAGILSPADLVQLNKMLNSKGAMTGTKALVPVCVRLVNSR